MSHSKRKKKRKQQQQLSPTASMGGCFPAGTLVVTRTGFKQIQDIKLGDLVLAFDDAGKLHEGFVYETSEHPNHEIWEYRYWGGTIAATPNHFVLAEGNAFTPIGEMGVDEALYDKHNRIRPLEGARRTGKATVYNLRVRDYHTYLVGEHGIRVHNGGGGKAASSPTEEQDDGRSTSKASVTELLSEGVVEGLVGGLKGVYLDKTPIQNNDNTRNFKGFNYRFRKGTPDQSLINLDGSDEVAQENAVNVEVTKALSPITRTIVNPELDAIRVRLAITLQEYEEDGDIKGSEVQFRISTKRGADAPKVRVTRTIKAKFSSPVEFQYEMSVANLGGTISEYQVTVERLTDDSTEQRLIQKIEWQSYTEVIKNKIRYANSCVIAMEFDAEQFSSIPQRRYRLAGIRVPIPSNLSVAADRGLNFVSTTWDGTFSLPLKACADPAWILYALLTNRRWGLGRYIDASQVDKWSLYQCCLYNNEFISDGLGGVERRYQCHTQIQTKEKAIDVINAVASCANIKPYWAEGVVKFWQDRPGVVVKQFSQADVEDGVFIYGSTAVRNRYTTALVTWNDPNNFYERAVEPVEDPDGIERYGIQQVELAAYGCTSRGQAIRAGRWALYSSRYETETVTFTARSFASVVRPGDLIQVADAKRANIRYGGLIKAATTTRIDLDAPVVLNGTGFQVTVMHWDGSLETKPINNVPGIHDFLITSTPLIVPPPVESTWLISTDQIKPQIFRVLSVSPAKGDPTKTEIVGISHNPGKYAAIEQEIEVTPTPIRLGTPTPPLPVTFAYAEARRITTADGQVWVLDGSWGLPGDGTVSSVVVEWSNDQVAWQGTRTVAIGSSTTRYQGITGAGTYQIRVATVSINGLKSIWWYSNITSAQVINLSLNYNNRYTMPD
jgi:predicted phage tail protein